MTLWAGRFGDEGPAEELLAFTVSLPFDRLLAADDLEGSRAHVRGLERAGVLTREDVTILVARSEDEYVGGELLVDLVQGAEQGCDLVVGE